MDEHPCDDCGRLYDIGLLDAVLLDVDGNDASEKIYCKQCWPKHKIVADDMWRPALSSSERTDG